MLVIAAGWAWRERGARSTRAARMGLRRSRASARREQGDGIRKHVSRETLCCEQKDVKTRGWGLACRGVVLLDWVSATDNPEVDPDDASRGRTPRDPWAGISCPSRPRTESIGVAGSGRC